MATSNGAATIGAAVRSLARQTLDHSRFELVVVQNGPPDHSFKVLDEVCADHPDLVVRRSAYSTPGLGRARNVGMAMARGDYVTFVDDDDTVSAGYLKGLLASADRDTVAVAHLADIVDVDSPPDFANRIASQLPYAGRTLSPGDLMVVLSYSVGKLLPTGPARRIGFDPDLRSGEDIAFYLKFFIEFPLNVRLCPIQANAVYYRRVVPGSNSRKAPSYDFSVTQRLDVIERIQELRPVTRWQHRAVAHMTSAQTGRINEFLVAHPERHVQVLADVRARGLTNVPYERLNSGIARDLAIVGPVRDADATWERLRALGMLLDLVRVDGTRLQVPPAVLLDATTNIPTAPSAGYPGGTLAACERAIGFVQDRHEAKGPYLRLYSGQTGNVAALLAAWYKVRNPQVAWTADFSMPSGTAPERLGRTSELLAELSEALIGRGFTPPAHDEVDMWALLVQAAFADAIVFASEAERNRLLVSLGDDPLATRVMTRSVIVRDPAMLAAAYQSARPEPWRARRWRKDRPAPWIAAPTQLAGLGA